MISQCLTLAIHIEISTSDCLLSHALIGHQSLILHF